MLIPTATLLTLFIVIPEISGQMFPFSNLWHYFNNNIKPGGGGGGGAGGGGGGGYRGILSGGHKNDLDTAPTTGGKPPSPNRVNANGNGNTTLEPGSTILTSTSTTTAASTIHSRKESTVGPPTIHPRNGNVATISARSTPPLENDWSRLADVVTTTILTDTTFRRDAPFTYPPPTPEFVTRPPSPPFVRDYYSPEEGGGSAERTQNQYPAEKRLDYEPDKSGSNDYNAYIDTEAEDYPAETPRPTVADYDRRDSYRRRGETPVPTVADFDQRDSYNRGDETPRPTIANFNRRNPYNRRAEKPKPTIADFGQRDSYNRRAEKPRPTIGDFDQGDSYNRRIEKPRPTIPDFDEGDSYNRRTEKPSPAIVDYDRRDDDYNSHTEQPRPTVVDYDRRDESYNRRNSYQTREPANEDESTETYYGQEHVTQTREPLVDYGWEIRPVPVKEIKEEKLPEVRRKLKPNRGQNQSQKQRQKEKTREELSDEQIFEDIRNNLNGNLFKETTTKPQRNRNGGNKKPPKDSGEDTDSDPDSKKKPNSKSDFGVFDHPVYLNPFQIQPQNNPFRVNNGQPGSEGYTQINYVNPISTPNPFTTTAYSIIPFTQPVQQDFTGLEHFDVSTKRLPTPNYDSDTTPFKLDWNFFNTPQTPVTKPVLLLDPQQASFTTPFQVPISNGGNPGLTAFNPQNAHSFNPQNTHSFNPQNTHSHSQIPPKSNVETLYPHNNLYASPTPPPSRVLANVRPLYSTPKPLLALTTTTPPHADYPVTHVIKYSKESPFHFPFLESEEPIIESLPAISFALNEHTRAQHLEKDDVVDYLTPPKLELPPPKQPKSKPKKKKLPSRRNKHYKSLNKDSDYESKARELPTGGVSGAYHEFHDGNFGGITPLAWGQDPEAKNKEEDSVDEEKNDEERRSNEEPEYDECATDRENCDYTEADDERGNEEAEGEEKSEEEGEEEEEEEPEEKDVKKRPPSKQKKHKFGKNSGIDGSGRSQPEFDFSAYFPKTGGGGGSGEKGGRGGGNKEEVDEEEEEEQDETEIEESMKNQRYHIKPDKDIDDDKSPIKKNFRNSGLDSRENFIKDTDDKNQSLSLRTRRPDAKGNLLGESNFGNHRVSSTNDRTSLSKTNERISTANNKTSPTDGRVPGNESSADNRVKKSNTDEELDNQKQDFTRVPKYSDPGDFDSGFTDDDSSETSDKDSSDKDEGGDRVEFQMQGHSGPDSYKFGFDTGKGDNRQFRYEEKENDGTVKGHYGYYDQHGKLHVVNYAAHPDHGFQAEPAT